MTKKVLVLSASFRKHGNSDMLCDRFIQGAREAGNEVEKIYVSDMRIGYCGLRRLQPDAQMRAKRRYGRRIGQDGCG